MNNIILYFTWVSCLSKESEWDSGGDSIIKYEMIVDLVLDQLIILIIINTNI